MSEFDHVDVYILTTVNELAARYGLRPLDFSISYRRGDDRNPGTFSFDTAAAGREEQLQRMAEACGAVGGEITGGLAGIVDALDGALMRAPNVRRR